MRTATTILACFLAMVFTVAAGADLPAGARRGDPARSPLPGTLDAFYPPAAGQPVYLFGMLGLGTSFSGIVADLMEDDLEGAKNSFEDFRKLYREAAAMVPEWKDRYPEEPVRELGAALAAGDRGAAMNAFGAVGESCHRCHIETMVPAQQKYHWGDFGAVTVKDPLSGTATAYVRFKQFLAANLAGITVDLRQGQADNARKQFEGFKARFQALGDSCLACHERKAVSFVGRDVQDAVDAMGRAFGKKTVDADAVTALSRKIGRESCSRCHLVHVPAAMAGTSRR